MGWITMAGGSSVVTKPIFTRKNNKDVLLYLQRVSPNFVGIETINNDAGVGNIKETQIILNDLVRRKLIEQYDDTYRVPAPYTQEQYDAVLKFFQENAGIFYTVNEVDEKAKIGSEGTTQAIIDAQVEDPKTGVRKDPKSGKYGIPKKGKK
tara:strand:- start:292 stop:744 length:453 start_codon:yes stop_codon:yes gene_type:complete